MKQALHTEIPFSQFVSEQVFRTKSGENGIILKLSPRDSECMEGAEISTTARRFETSMRLVPIGCRVYQYLIKRRVEGGVFELAVYQVILGSIGVEEIDQIGVAICRHMSRTEGDSAAVVLDQDQMYRFFRGLLNYDPVVADAVRLKRETYLDYYAGDSQIEIHRDHLRVGDTHAKIMVLKDPPLNTHGDALAPLRALECEFIAVIEWKSEEMQAIRSVVAQKSRYFHVASFAFNFRSASRKESDSQAQKDQSAVVMGKQLGQLMADIEENGTTMGQFALTVIVFDAELKRCTDSAGKLFKAFAATDMIFYEERVNLMSAWLAALPGGHRHQHRAMYLTDKNFADFSFLFLPAAGKAWNDHLRARSLTILKTRQRTVYHANLHYGDVGHALISGMTGAGKSYTAAHLIEEAKRHYDPQIIIFDVGGSYRSLVKRLGGSYLEVGLDYEYTINPFLLPATTENHHFLFALVKVLLESGKYQLTELEEIQLFNAIPGVHRLRELSDKLTENLKGHLARWTYDGQYARLFDNPEDTLNYDHLQAFDFERLEQYPRIVQPLLFYILHRADNEIYARGGDKPFRIFMLDEAWRFLEHPTVCAYIRGALKTWRKHNAAMWMATQSMEDLDRTEMLRTVAENCGYLVLLPNPRLNRDHYRDVFKLNEVELDMVATMQPKREMLFKPAVGESKVVILEKE